MVYVHNFFSFFFFFLTQKNPTEIFALLLRDKEKKNP